MDPVTKLIDLHLHLDGAISLKSARQLAQMQQLDIPEDDTALREIMQVSSDCSSLDQFLEKFDFPCALLQTPQGLETAMYNLCEELKDQGLIYAEIRFAPQRLMKMSQEDAVKAVLAGMNRSSLGSRKRISLILTMMRGELTDSHIATYKETIRLAKKYQGKGVCALDLAGAEAPYPTAGFEPVFAYAHSLGVPFEIHAGEGDGPESIDAALRLGASRIGHGTHCIEDASLMKLLAEKKIPLMMCPTSNVQTGVVSSIRELPVRTYLNTGIVFCINSDDPSVSGTDIRTEWQKVISTFRLTKAEIHQLMLHAVEASFAPDTVRAQLREEMEACYGD